MALLLILNMQLVEKYNLMPMYEVLRHYSNHNAAVIFLAQAGHESKWGRKGACRWTGYNWWGVKKKHSRKYQTWELVEEAAYEFCNLISQEYENAWRAALHGDVKDYVHWVKHGGYFEDTERNYLAGVRRHLKMLTKKEAKDGK